jgi:hypothetical protein
MVTFTFCVFLGFGTPSTLTQESFNFYLVRVRFTTKRNLVRGLTHSIDVCAGLVRMLKKVGRLGHYCSAS